MIEFPSDVNSISGNPDHQLKLHAMIGDLSSSICFVAADSFLFTSHDLLFSIPLSYVSVQFCKTKLKALKYTARSTFFTVDN